MGINTSLRAGETLSVLKDGKPFQLRFETCFTVTWPENLGGGSAKIDTCGVIVLEPVMSAP